jgi:hypothetical protein
VYVRTLLTVTQKSRRSSLNMRIKSLLLSSQPHSSFALAFRDAGGSLHVSAGQSPPWGPKVCFMPLKVHHTTNRCSHSTSCPPMSTGSWCRFHSNALHNIQSPTSMHPSHSSAHAPCHSHDVRSKFAVYKKHLP